jgi:hypothetical protein
MNREDLLDERMKKLNSEAQEDFQLDDYTLKEKSLASPNIKIKWTRILMEEQRLLKVMEEKRDEYKRSILDTKFDVNVAQFKKEIAIDGDEGMVKFKAAIENQKDVIRFVEGILKIAQGFGFDLKNAIDIVKLEQ